MSFGNLLTRVLVVFAFGPTLVIQAAPTLSLIAPAMGTTTTTPNKGASLPIISSDGRYVTFSSNSTNLIANFTDNNEASQQNGASDIFQRDLQTGTTTLVTHKTGSTSDGANSRFTGSYRVSDDGRYVFFASDATDLVTGKGPGQRAYLWDRTTNLVTFVVDAQTQGVAISGDGNYLVMYTDDDMPKNIYNLGLGSYTGPQNGYNNAYLINRVSGAVTMITHTAASTTTATNFQVQGIVISGDGRYVAFETSGFVTGWDTVTGSYDRVSGFTSEAAYLWDRDTDTFKLITKRNDGTGPVTTGQGLNSPSPQSISADGRYVFFTCANVDVDFGTATTDNDGVSNLYRYDRDGGSTKLARFFFDVYNYSPNGATGAVNYSPNGRYMVFVSLASNIVSGDTNGRQDVFRLDTTTNALERVNVNSGGGEWTNASNGILIGNPAALNFSVAGPRVDNSGNVAFSSNAVGLGFTDSNALADALLATFSAAAVAPTVTTATQASVTATSATLGGNVTADGGASVTDRGIVWATTSNPTTSDTKVANGTGTGAFSATVTGLTANSTIHVRAYAINSVGTSYGSDISFSTPASDTTKPTVVSIVRQSPAGQALTTATTSITFRVTYSEAVTGVVAANFQLDAINGGTATGTIGTPSPVSTSVYDIPVTLTGGSGEFRLKVVN